MEKSTKILLGVGFGLAAIAGYFWWKNNQTPTAETSNDTGSSDTNADITKLPAAAFDDATIKSPVKSQHDTVPFPSVKSSKSGYLVNQSMYFKDGVKQTGAYNFPAATQANTVGVIYRRGDKAPAVFIADAGTKGWIKAKAIVTNKKNVDTAQVVYVMASQFTPTKP